MADWERLLNEFDREVLERLGVYWLPSDQNPITEALATNSEIVRELSEIKGFGKGSFARLASICQMAFYDDRGGPDGDGKRKGLRRQWYSWFKTRFSQPFSAQLARMGDDKESQGFDGTAWAGRLSSTYSDLVDNEGVTYWDLWVDDASRMAERFWQSLFRGLHIMIAVEKDSLFSDFKAAAKAIGARSLVSGKGKQSKAATEKFLREHFNWSVDNDPFSKREPLIILHISDHDMDGEAVIGPTFGTQARRYTPYVVERRVGIRPGQVEDWVSNWYETKVTNKGYTDWAEEKGLFLFDCHCGNQWTQQGLNPKVCPSCGDESWVYLKLGKEIENQPFGFEVEALPTRVYYRFMVSELLEVIPFETVVSRLRDECVADADRAAKTILVEVLSENQSYQDLLEELARFDRLNEIKEEFERRVEGGIRSIARNHTEDFRDLEDDPEPSDFEDHVEGASDWDGPWRPFSTEIRTEALTNWIREEREETVQEYKDEILEW